MIQFAVISMYAKMLTKVIEDIELFVSLFYGPDPEAKHTSH